MLLLGVIPRLTKTSALNASHLNVTVASCHGGDVSLEFAAL